MLPEFQGVQVIGAPEGPNDARGAAQVQDGVVAQSHDGIAEIGDFVVTAVGQGIGKAQKAGGEWRVLGQDAQDPVHRASVIGDGLTQSHHGGGQAGQGFDPGSDLVRGDHVRNP